MPILRDDGLSLTRGGARRRTRGRIRVAFVGLLFVSLALLLLSRLDHTGLRDLRWRASELLAPVLETASGPLSHVRAWGRRLAALRESADEIERLKQENRRLAAEAAEAGETARRLAELERATRTAVSPGIGSVTARVVATSSGAFVRSVTISAGREHGVRPGYPVMVTEGLIGRVVEAGRLVSRVMLITDVGSRIPVLVGAGRHRAMLSGDNGAVAKLEFVASGAEVREGDAVVTSGTGGLFPAGVRVGSATARDGREPRITPHARLDELEYVRVLLYESPMLELVGDPARAAADAGKLAPRTGEPAPERR